MDADRIQIYQQFKPLLEEPIREIVPALWGLPFVEDTYHTCSGHVVALRQHATYVVADTLDERTLKKVWYPHRTMLHLYFSVSPEMAAERDRFRDALKGVKAEYRGRDHFFDDCREYEGTILGDKTNKPVLVANYDGNFPDAGTKTIDYVLETEEVLTRFWEQVAAVIHEFNPSAHIGPIQGKDFRTMIDWDCWQFCFAEQFEHPGRPMHRTGVFF
ncbi:MAG: hypothetical protein Q7R76_04740 [Candidatus Woesearchaeota archaeon]|nr:hypothetical protein [Candidatus Woesearchaeota archaeon]